VKNLCFSVENFLRLLKVVLYLPHLPFRSFRIVFHRLMRRMVRRDARISPFFDALEARDPGIDFAIKLAALDVIDLPANEEGVASGVQPDFVFLPFERDDALAVANRAVFLFLADNGKNGLPNSGRVGVLEDFHRDFTRRRRGRMSL
jgi:hypothetical protein